MSGRLTVRTTAKANNGLRAGKEGRAPEETGSTMLRLSKALPTGKRKVSGVLSKTSVGVTTGGIAFGKASVVRSLVPIVERMSCLLLLTV
jgi:hypothetical protein